MRRIFTSEKKAAIAREALKGEKSIVALSQAHQIHPTQIKQWKETLETGSPTLFADKRRKEHKEKDQLIDELYKLVGKLNTELAWLKKKLFIDTTRASVVG
jgi:transposase-like protein